MVERNYDSIQAYKDLPVMKWSMKNSPLRRNHERSQTQLLTDNTASNTDLDTNKNVTLNMSKVKMNNEVVKGSESIYRGSESTS